MEKEKSCLSCCGCSSLVVLFILIVCLVNLTSCANLTKTLTAIGQNSSDVFSPRLDDAHYTRIYQPATIHHHNRKCKK